MVYEAEITIRRDDPAVLADDFQAITKLLEQRKAARHDQRSKSGATGRDLRLVPTANA